MQSNQRLLTPTFFLAFTANFFMALNFSNNAVYPLYVTYEGGDAGSIGMFMGVFSLAAVLGRPLIGLLIDRWGIRPVWMIGALFLGLPSLGYYFLLGNGLSYYVWTLRAIQGLGFGAHFTAFFTLAGATAPPGRRNENISKYGLSGIMAMLIGPFLGEQIIRQVGLEAFLLTMTSFGIITFLIITRIRETGDTETSDQLPAPSSLFRSFRSPGMRLAFLLALLIAIASSTPSTFIAPVATERGVQGFGLYFTGFAITGTFIRLIGSRWGDRFGQRRVLVPGFLLYTVALLTISSSHSIIGIFIAGLIGGLAHGIAFPAVTSMGYSLAPKAHAGSAMALITGLMDGGSAIAAFTLGKIAVGWGYDAVFPCGAIGPGLATLVVLVSILRKPEPIKSRADNHNAA